MIYSPYIQDLERLKAHLNAVDSEAIPQEKALTEFQSGAVSEIPTEINAIESAQVKTDPSNLPSQRLTLLSAQESRDKEIHNLIKKGYKAELEKEAKKSIQVETSPPTKRKKGSNSETKKKPKKSKNQKRSVYDIFTL